MTTDEDECLHHPCSHLCSNTNGSFECFCMSGFELQEDGHTCEGTVDAGCLVQLIVQHIVCGVTLC